MEQKGQMEQQKTTMPAEIRAAKDARMRLAALDIPQREFVWLIGTREASRSGAARSGKVHPADAHAQRARPGRRRLACASRATSGAGAVDSTVVMKPVTTDSGAQASQAQSNGANARPRLAPVNVFQ